MRRDDKMVKHLADIFPSSVFFALRFCLYAFETGSFFSIVSLGSLQGG
jgi:hypothetical protein